MLNRASKICQEGKMKKIEQFKEFPNAIAALKSKTADVAIVEVREGDRAEDVACHVIVGNDYLAREIRELPHYYRVNDFSGFPTFWVFKGADEIQTELN